MAAAPLINLGKLVSGATPVELSKTDVSRFKEADENPRVVADSADFIVYSLKSRTSLRVLPKKSQNQLLFKQHASPVKAARFVNYSSNIVASYSDTELWVWYIDMEKAETVPYFSASIGVRNLCWMFREKTPELLVLEGSTVKILPTSRLIEQQVSTATSQHFRTILEGVTDQVSLLAARDKSIAVAAHPNAVITGSNGELSGNSWHPCDKQPIQFMSFCGPSLLAVATKDAVFIWNVEGAPRPAMKLDLAGLSPLSVMEPTTSQSSQSTVELFFTNSTALFINLEQATVAYTKLFGTVRSGGFCSSNAADSITVLADFGNILSYSYVYPSTKTIPLGARPGGAPSPQNDANGRAPGAIPLVSTGGLPGMTSPMMMGGMPPNYSSQSLIRNPALVGVGGGASLSAAADNASQQLSASGAELERALANLKQMISLGRTMVSSDNEKLTQRALQSQANQIQSQLRGSSGGPVSADSQYYRCTADDLQLLMEKLTAAITMGIAPAVEEAIAKNLEPALQAEIGRTVRKDIAGDIRAKLNEALGNASNEFAQKVEEKIRQQTDQCVGYVRQIQQEYNAAMGQLQDVIQQQHEMLAEYQRANILSQLEDMRKQVGKLKSGAPVDTAAAGAPAPETIVSTAKQFIQSKDFTKGLEWVTRFNNAELTISLLTGLNDSDLNEALVADPAVSDSLWTVVLGHLTMTQNVDTLDAVVWWIESVMLEHEGLTSNNQLKTLVAAFIKTWRAIPAVPPTVSKNLSRLNAVLK